MARQWGRLCVPLVALLLACSGAGPSNSPAEGQNPEGQGTGQNKKFPRRVLIIRHAEKPPEESDSVHLAPEGEKRAAALPDLFKASKKRPDPFPAPDFIFATKNTKHSHRPVETVAALAKTLKLDVNSTFQNEDFAKLARELFENPRYGGKTILVSWHHGEVPHLAQELKATDAPDSWKGSVFDRVWEITYDERGAATFRNRPQQLLARDSEK